jgi:hypothetical protein
LLAASAVARLNFGVHQTGRFRFLFARLFDGVHRFLAQKTIDGEQFLKRIQVRVAFFCGWFVVGN